MINQINCLDKQQEKSINLNKIKNGFLKKRYKHLKKWYPEHKNG